MSDDKQPDDTTPTTHGTGPTNNPDAADGDYTPHTANSPVKPIEILQTQAAALHTLAHGLGVELRRHLIPLVHARLVPVDVACRILQRAGLPELPRIWTVQLTVPFTAERSHTTVEELITALRNDIDRAAEIALGDAATVDWPQPLPLTAWNVLGADHPDRYKVEGRPTVTGPIRAETRREAQAAAITQLHAALTALPGLNADLDLLPAEVEPQRSPLIDLDVDLDAPYQPFTPPPRSSITHVSAARASRQLATEAWRYRVRRIRAALIDTLNDGDLHNWPGRYGPYGLIDGLLRDLGLPGLPYAHLYEITATIPITVTADSPAAARSAAYSRLRDVFANHPQHGLPITGSYMFRDPDIGPADHGQYRVRWHETYLVSQRAINSSQLAEHAVRLQLSVLSDAVPDVAAIPLRPTYLGEYIDHRLDPDRD